VDEKGHVTMPTPSKSKSTEKSTVTSDKRHVAPAVSRRNFLQRTFRWETFIGWLFVLPALLMYVVFVLVPFTSTIQYSFFKWNGVGPATWVGLKNYVNIFQVPNLIGTVINAFWLVVWFSIIPVGLGLVVASVIHRVATGRLGSISRTVLFLPNVIPLVAAGIIWGWLLALPGLINQILEAFGLGAITRAWLGDFDMALPAVGVVGIWVLLGFCIVLLLTGMSKVDPALYESARIDGAGWFREFVAITVPLLKYEIGVCLTVTVVAALAAFDIIWVTTAGGPGSSTSVPGVQIYILGFTQRAIGPASALAVMLMALVVLVIIPIQWLSKERAR
jgi:raffinose/stachyose/melibiose transport system permease protein